jgi:exosortase
MISEAVKATATGTEDRLSEGMRLAQASAAFLLLVIATSGILRGIYGSWFDEHAYMEHGVLAVPAAGYMVWVMLAKLRKIQPAPSRWGIALLIFGAFQAVAGVAAQWLWISRTAVIVSLVGCIAAFYGLRMVKELLFPLAVLALSIAPPTFVYEVVTLKLQLLSSQLGEFFLELFGFSVLREGNILELAGTKLSVEEACSGLRSMLSILFMCVLYNFFFVRGTPRRALILLTAVPIAILGNAARIVATGIASQYNPNLIHGAAHETFGYISVVLAGLGLVLVHLASLYVGKGRRVHA